MPEQQTRTVLALVLRDYRSQHHLNQEQLALDLNVDIRTLRRWEQREARLRDICELKRIAVILGTDPERLGVTNVTAPSFTGDAVDEFVAKIWHLVYEARVAEAHTMAEKLIQALTVQIKSEKDPLLHKLAQVHQVAGFVKAMRTRADDIASSLAHYQEMGTIARMVADDTLRMLALAYEGDMHCRSGNVGRGICCLETARATALNADLESSGLTALLLGRAYLKSKRVQDFEREMTMAEGMAACVEPGTNMTYGQYRLGTVYAEYGYSYALLGKLDQAIAYLERAEKHLEHTTYWEILLTTARAVALVQNGDFGQGIPMAQEAIKLCKRHGTLRLLERMYAIRRHLDRMSWRTHQISLQLQEALDGSLEPPLWHL